MYLALHANKLHITQKKTLDHSKINWFMKNRMLYLFRQTVMWKATNIIWFDNVFFTITLKLWPGEKTSINNSWGKGSRCIFENFNERCLAIASQSQKITIISVAICSDFQVPLFYAKISTYWSTNLCHY